MITVHWLILLLSMITTGIAAFFVGFSIDKIDVGILKFRRAKTKQKGDPYDRSKIFRLDEMKEEPDSFPFPTTIPAFEKLKEIMDKKPIVFHSTPSGPNDDYLDAYRYLHPGMFEHKARKKPTKHHKHLPKRKRCRPIYSIGVDYSFEELSQECGNLK